MHEFPYAQFLAIHETSSCQMLSFIEQDRTISNDSILVLCSTTLANVALVLS